MWTIKTFKTRDAMMRFIARNEHRIQYREVFVNNAYAIDYRPLRFIG
jgi:hypothetical protein